LYFQRLMLFCLMIAACCTLAGCGGGDAGFAPVTGVVTYQDQPIGKINVMFVPTDLKGQIAEGTTDENGKFKLQTLKPGDGAQMGNYKVSFKYVSDIIPDMPGFDGGVKPEVSIIPLKYADENTSGFTASVASSKNDFQFDLK